MNRVCASAWALVLVLETGCPVGGEAGVLHQAMFKDTVKRLANDSCQPGDVEDGCGPDFKKCMASCQEEMKRRRDRQ